MRLFGTLAVCLFLSACASSDGDGSVPDDGIDGGSITEVPTPEDDTVKPQTPSADAPKLTLDDVGAATEYSSVPVSGMGPPGGTVIVVGDTGRAARAEIDANGAFCLDVLLATAQVNTLKVQAVDNRGRYSEVVEKKVEQTAPTVQQPPTDEDPLTDLEPINVALEAGIQTNMSMENGALDSVLDSNWSTGPRFYANATTTEWISLGIRAAVEIDKITIVGSATCFMESVLIQVKEVADQAWLDFYRGSDIETPVLQAVSPLGKMRAKYIAITPTGYGCGWTRGIYDIKEIQIWTTPRADGGSSTPTTPTTDGPTCANR